MRIESLTDGPWPAWDRMVGEDPAASVYGDSAWLRLFQQSFGYRQKGLALWEGDEIKAGLPLFEVRGLTGRKLVSTPFRDRGGAVGGGPEQARVLLTEAVKLFQDGGYSSLLIRQGSPMPEVTLEGLGLLPSPYWVNTVLDLTPGAEAIWKRLKNNAQGPVKQAVRQGVAVTVGREREDMEAFYQVFLESRREMGVPCFSREFFLGIWDGLCSQNKARLLLAKRGEETVAGVILLLWRGAAIDGYAASLDRHRELRPNDLLVWESIRWAAEAGCTVFDFGADSPRQKGLLAFKRKWGGVHQPAHAYYLTRAGGEPDQTDSSDPLYVWPRKVLSSLPRPLFRLVSRWTVASFG